MKFIILFCLGQAAICGFLHYTEKWTTVPRQMRRAARGVSPLIFEAFDLKHGDAILKTDLMPKQ